MTWRPSHKGEAIATSRLIACIFCLAGLMGCTVGPAGGRQDGLYLGLVRVKADQSGGGRDEKIAVLGGWIESRSDAGASTGIGLRKRSTLILPLECRVVIRVRDRADLDRLMAAIGPVMTGDEKPCAIPDD